MLLLSFTIANSQDSTKITTTAVDPTPTFRFFNRGDNFIDLKFVDPTKGSFGIDYKLSLIRELGTLGKDIEWKNLRFGLSSNGFVTVANDKNPNNSIINQLDFDAFPLFRTKQKKEIKSLVSWRDFPDLPENFDPLTDPLIVLARERAQQVASPFWLFFNLHAKHETTQDFKNYDFALGSQISISSFFLSRILDLPFGFLRYGKNNNPRYLDLSVGYDYVFNMDKTQIASLLDNQKYMNRLNLKAEWETGIFTKRDRLILLFDSYHDLKPTQALKNANKDWNNFFMAKVEHLLSESYRTNTRTKVSIKYTNGELPPNFNKGYVLGGGFSIEF